MADEERELEVIKEDMDHTRAALAEKLQALDQNVISPMQQASTTVAETVSDVKSAVTETVEGVKDAFGSVADKLTATVESVKHTLDFRGHVENHPWGAVGTAVAVGFVGGLLTGGRSRRDDDYYSRRETPAAAAFTSPGNGYPAADKESDEPGPFDTVVETLRKLSLGVLLGSLREMAAQAVPSDFTAKVSEMFDNLTTKLGAEPMRVSGVQQQPQPEKREPARPAARTAEAPAAPARQTTMKSESKGRGRKS